MLGLGLVKAGRLEKLELAVYWRCGRNNSTRVTWYPSGSCTGPLNEHEF